MMTNGPAGGADHAEVEEGSELRLDFEKLRKVGAGARSVVPAVAQDRDSGEVLIIGYADQTALEYSLEHKVATFWSTSRNELWIKGAQSGDYLDLHEVRVNCEQNSLLYIVSARGSGACHTRDASGKSRASCFYRRVLPDGRLVFVNEAG